ncbi:MAG TPA: hypothetical protein VGO60_13215 [Iamia sp.]|nr:hypothetical protein [Iamia sp.]
MPEIPAPSSPPSGSDWPAQATDAIVGLIDSVKEKVNGPATSIARGVVYGTLAALVGTAALVLFLVLLVRGFDVLAQVLLDLADAERAGRSAWIAHIVTGLMFLVPGAILWRKGTRAPGPATD